MTATRRNSPEDDLQKAVVKFLRHALDGNSFGPFAIPNGGYRHKTEAKRLKELGVVAGVPDLCVVNDGRAIFLELKAPKAPPSATSDDQLYCHAQIRKARAPVTVCRSLEDVIAALQAAGVPLRAQVAA